MSKPFSIRQRIKSFGYAWKGIKALISSEHNAWIHCIVAAVAIAAGFFFNITREEWLAVTLCIGMVLAAEAFNTAIEKLVDFVSPGRSQAAGKVKDLAAGAVLITAAASVVCGLIIFIPYIL